MAQLPAVDFDGLSYKELVTRLDGCELLGLSYQDLLTDLERDLHLGIDGMPVQNAKPADGSVLVWTQSKGAWIPTAPQVAAGVTRGSVSVTTSGVTGQGGTTVTHGLATTPAVVMLTESGTNSFNPITYTSAIGATTFNANIQQGTASVFTYTVQWLAVL